MQIEQNIQQSNHLLALVMFGSSFANATTSFSPTRKNRGLLLPRNQQITPRQPLSHLSVHVYITKKMIRTAMPDTARRKRLIGRVLQESEDGRTLLPPGSPTRRLSGLPRQELHTRAFVFVL